MQIDNASINAAIIVSETAKAAVGYVVTPETLTRKMILPQTL